MKAWIICCLLCFGLIHSPIHACLNEEYAQSLATAPLSPLELSMEASNRFFPLPNGHRLDTSSATVRDAMTRERSLYLQGDFSGSANYGIYLIHFQKYDLAEKIFRQNLEKWPDRYSSHANLGTILEVNGKLEEALIHLKKSLAISPYSHDTSEWIHVKILEAKLNGKISGPAILGIDFGQGDTPKASVSIEELMELQRHLFYQLNERVTFVPAPDEVIAALMFELGNMTKILDGDRRAHAIYEVAQRYGCQNPLLEKRLALTSDEAVDVHLPKPPFPWGMAIAGIALAIVLGGAAIWKSWRMLQRLPSRNR